MSSLKLYFCLLFASVCLVPSTSSATEPITNDNIQTAVNAWITNPSTATTTYGHISTWDVSAVTDMENLFKETSFNDDIGNWNVANVKNMFCMFTDATAFNQDISGWDVSSVTNMQRIFQDASDFNKPLDAWGAHIDKTKINKIAYLFKNAEDFNQPLSSWDVSGVTSMQGMFEGASAFDQDISSWDVSAMLNMNGVFKNATSFNQDLGDWGSKMGQVNNLSYMFFGATSFVGTGDDGGVSTWDVSNATNMARIFMNADNFNGDITSWDVGEATSMERLFLNASSFNSDLSTWEVDAVTNMTSMFGSATLFNSDLSTWEVGAVTDMSGMFSSATAFNSDLSNWDVGEVTNMEKLFLNATNFNQDLSNWCVENIDEEPTNFATNSDLATENYPDWGNCNSDDAGDGDSGDEPPMTINDFMILEGSGSQVHKTELLSKAISQLNAGLDNSSQVTIMDFLKGMVVDGDVHMEVDLQSIVDAINGESSDTSQGTE
jgi:surface protein